MCIYICARVVACVYVCVNTGHGYILNIWSNYFQSYVWANHVHHTMTVHSATDQHGKDLQLPRHLEGGQDGVGTSERHPGGTGEGAIAVDT